MDLDNKVFATSEQIRFSRILNAVSNYQLEGLGTYSYTGDNRITDFQVQSITPHTRTRLNNIKKELKKYGYFPLDFLFESTQDSREENDQLHPILIYSFKDGTFATIKASQYTYSYS